MYSKLLKFNFFGEKNLTLGLQFVLWTKFYDYENDLDLKLCFFRHEHGVADHHILVHILPADELQHLNIYQIRKKKMK